ncbi:anion transporter [Thermosynechococcus sp.]|uniref:anion transporter n=1 Tax=Thermosynechococcus sp. TaxID=2814275 RepID=UPI00391DE5BA
MLRSLLQLLILVLGYGTLALGGVPGLRMNRATIALVSAALLIALGAIDLPTAWQAIDPQTIVFLLSMMIVNAYLSLGGFFQIAMVTVVRFSGSPLGLLVFLSVATGMLSAVFLNDTLALVTTPLTLRITHVLGLNPVPYLLAIAGATNIGSVATLSGNPQNILVGSFSALGYLQFAQVMIPVAVLGLGLQVIWLGWLYPEVRSRQPCPLATLQPAQVQKGLLHKTLIVSGLMFLAFLVGLPLAESSLLAAGALLVTRRLKPERVLAQVDWSLLVLFAGLFILTRCIQNFDLLGVLRPWVNQPLPLVVTTALLSNLISNVPTVLLLAQFIPHDADQLWYLLAATSTLAGNLTLFGAVANLITVEAAASSGQRFSFWQHLRFGAPLTVLTLAIAYAWITSQT